MAIAALGAYNAAATGTARTSANPAAAVTGQTASPASLAAAGTADAPTANSASRAATGETRRELLPIVRKALYDKESVWYTDLSRYPVDFGNLPIGVFDSGTGGFTVLEKMLSMDRFDNKTGAEVPDGIPDFAGEDFQYLGDQANMPYGRYAAEGKEDYLRELAVKDALFLMGRRYSLSREDVAISGAKSPVKMVVIACNTATAYGLGPIQDMTDAAGCPVKVIGVVNAGSASALDAVSSLDTASLAVLATPGTVASGVYERTLRSLAPSSQTLEIFSQPGVAFAEAVDEKHDFVDRSLTTFSDNYRGPVFGDGDEDIHPEILDAYNFDFSGGAAFISRDPQGRPLRIQLNSADNYARYNLMNLYDRARRSGALSRPLDCIILGCTHYPFCLEVMQQLTDELRDYTDSRGGKPYAAVISDSLKFIDPADNTAYECWRLLHDNGMLNSTGAAGRLWPYISVASASLPLECLDSDGGLSYEFKYGRLEGTEEMTTLAVPVSHETMSEEAFSRIERLLPLSYKGITDSISREQVISSPQSRAASPFTPWTVITDFGIIALLLLISKVIRVKWRLMQRLFIPTPLIAGLLGLALGPNGAGWLPLSSHTGTYASILIACVFACLPFTSASRKTFNKDVGRMWVYAQSGLILQWTLGAVLGLTLVRALWPGLNPAFGLALPAGFCGGHGTAAAIGTAFAGYNYEDMLSIAMTSATVGIICAVLLGLLFIKIGTVKGYTSFLTDFKDLPGDMRTGLVPAERQESLGEVTTSSMSIDSLTLNLCAILSCVLGGWGLSKAVKHFVPSLDLPVFCCAFIAGIVLVALLKGTRTFRHFSPRAVGHLSGTFTDLLIVCGISSIKLSAVAQYLLPLAVVLAIGLVLTFLYVFLAAKRIMPSFWFEKAIFEWGWYTGTVAMGLALLRVVDPDQRSHCLEDYGIAYMFIAPVEIALVTFSPLAFMTGHGWLFAAICLAGLALTLVLGRVKGWSRR